MVAVEQITSRRSVQCLTHLILSLMAAGMSVPNLSVHVQLLVPAAFESVVVYSYQQGCRLQEKLVLCSHTMCSLAGPLYVQRDSA